MAEAARKLNIEYRVLARRAKKLNCFKSNQAGVGIKKNYPLKQSKFSIDENYFNSFSSQMAYWLGFIAADGNIGIRSENSKYFKFVLKEEDYKAVEKLKNDLKFTGNINKFIHHVNKKSFGCVSLQIFSKTLVEQLEKYGIVPRKSYKNIHFLSYIPQDFKKFFCFGFMDGDGHVGAKGESLSFLGSKEDCEEIAQLFNFNKFNIHLENDKFLYNLTIYKAKEIYKFSKEYLDFSQNNFVLPRKLERIKLQEQRYRNILNRKLLRILRSNLPYNYNSNNYIKNKPCPRCGKLIANCSSYCRECYNFLQRKVERPSKEKLLELIKSKPILQIAKQYKVSDNAIRKWCKSYDLPYKKKDIQNLK